MPLILATRILLYAQIVLGTLQSPGLYNGVPGILHTHRTLAFIIPVVAFFAFGPHRSAPGGLARVFARYGPAAALILGLINWVGFKMLAAIPVEAYFAVIGVHMLVGIAVVAFVEISAGKDRRARLAAQSENATAQ